MGGVRLVAGGFNQVTGIGRGAAALARVLLLAPGFGGGVRHLRVGDTDALLTQILDCAAWTIVAVAS